MVVFCLVVLSEKGTQWILFLISKGEVLKLYEVVVTFSCFFIRIIRAFLVEEQKIVKKVLKIQKAKEKLSSKS